ncbi:MAG: InlB B-repeat-containing protein [Lachnospiraceae bacterium]|nr:InlB B-repeat-containing protein [Lachnospiraceae bacterium]
MSKRFTRLLSLLLAVTLILGLTPAAASAAGKDQPDGTAPVHVYTEEENALIDNDVFASITAKTAEIAQPMGGVGKMTEEDYIAMIPEVIEVIENSSTYVPGSLQQNGNFLVWEITVGIPCCYSPRMEAKLHNTENEPTPAEIALAESRAEKLYQDLSEIQGGWPSSAKIGLIQPFWESTSNYADSSFNGYSPSYKAAWEAFCTATGGEGLRYSMSNATVDNIATVMSQCGLVMFDSHGDTDYSGSGGDYTSRANTSYIMLTTTSGITTQDTASQTGQYGTYHHAIKSGSYAYVDGTCIGYHMGNNTAPHSFLYMGICLGMATDGMEGGLRAKGVEAVWGYSQSVSFYGDEKYVKTLMGYLKDGDTLTAAAGKVKAQYGDWDPAYSNYSYSQCVANHVAFPIVASSEDPYPGHGNVDVVQTVYSTWTLYEQFEVNAISNNEEWGTVSANYNVITATPAEGYYTAGAEVISGTATVTQNGNVFIVSAESDCTIKINFAPREKFYVHFMVSGAELTTEMVYEGDSLTMPEATTDKEGWTFLGWAESEHSVTTDRPSFYSRGARFTPQGDKTFYALFIHREGGSTERVYELVTAIPDDWAGNYVITWNHDDSLYAMKGLNGNTYYQAASTGGAVALANTGMTRLDDQLRDVDDAYVFAVESFEGKFTIRNMGTGTYLANRDNILYSYSLDPDTCAWTFNLSGGIKIMARNQAGSQYTYLGFSSANKYFKMGSNATSAIRFWKEAFDGICYYTTAPYDWQETPHDHTYGDWTSNNNGTHSRSCTSCGDRQTENCSYEDVVTPPTATEGGYTTHTCTVCGYSFTDTYTDPLGYTIEFVNWDGTVLQSSNFQAGELPVYEGETPVREEEFHHYTFTGWDPEITAVTGPATYTAQFSDSVYALVNYMTLNLDGKLGINFFLSAPESAASAKLVFHGEKEETLDFDLVRDSAHGYLSSGMFRLSYSNVAMKEMTCPVTLTVYDEAGAQMDLFRANGEAVPDNASNFCVADWCNAIIETSTNQPSIDLAKAILHFGGAAQRYFGFNLDNFANPEGYLDAEAEGLEADPSLDRVVPEGADAVGYKNFALNLEGDTEIRVYFSKEITASDENGSAYEVVKSGKKWYVSIPGIAAKNLDDMFTVNAAFGGETRTFLLCGLSYANATFASSNSDLANLARALYLYNQAADAYFGN